MKDGPEATAVATIEGRLTAADGSSAPADSGGTPPGERGTRAAPDDRYRVIGRLGKGGMGDVMLVHDDDIGREVALKRMRKANPSDRLVRRFLREASVQGRLEHPAIVQLYDLGRDVTGQPYFTMKRLTGTTLAHILADGREGHTLQRLLRAFTDVCLAVEFAHTRGIIHRDLKPDNVFVGDIDGNPDYVKVLDFLVIIM
jgi:serine/threonine-protein kinase